MCFSPYRTVATSTLALVEGLNRKSSRPAAHVAARTLALVEGALTYSSLTMYKL